MSSHFIPKSNSPPSLPTDPLSQDFTSLNHGQSFDHVLEKIKQGMKAARGGGWVDFDSDSGSELELTTDQPTTMTTTLSPTEQESAEEDEEEDDVLTDSSSRSLRISTTTHPIPSSNSVSVQQPATSPFGPITPPPSSSTNSHLTSSSSSTPSPYVRHHFKWDFHPTLNPLDPTLSPQLSQPRLIETSSPSEHLSPTWAHHPSKHLIIPPPQSSPAHIPPASSTLFPHSPAPRPPTQPVYVRWNIPADNTHHHPTIENSRAQQHHQADHSNNNPQGLGTGLRPASHHQSTTHHHSISINPSSVSSVPFSLAPAAPIRLTAPNSTTTHRTLRSTTDRETIRASLVSKPTTTTTTTPVYDSFPNTGLIHHSPNPGYSPNPGLIHHSSNPGLIHHSQNLGLIHHSPNPGVLNHSQNLGLLNQSHKAFPTQTFRLPTCPPTFYTTTNTTTTKTTSPSTLSFGSPPTKPLIGISPLPSPATPLPGQVQPEEVRKSVKTQPPVVNTGNSGAMIPQPGDWMCMCGFVNWRRRKVCMRCFPFAEGNDSVGAMMAMNAQRAALLAAGGTITDHHHHQPKTPGPIFNPPTSVRVGGNTLKNPFDNSIPLESDQRSRRRSSSLGSSFRPLWTDHDQQLGGQNDSSLLVPSSSSTRQRTTTATTTTSPGSSWQAIRALWQ